MSLVNCPITPAIELTRMNKEVAVTICFGLPAFIKKRIGLKNMPPPIPTTPEIKPNIPPIKIEIIIGISLYFLLIDQRYQILS